MDEGISPSQRIDRAVMAWPGVRAFPHRFGGTEYRLGTREIGHVHGDSLVDVPLTRRLRDEAIAAGHAKPHHVLPESGWVSVLMHSMEDVAAAVELLRQSFDMAVAQRERRQHENDRSTSDG